MNSGVALHQSRHSRQQRRMSLQKPDNAVLATANNSEAVAARNSPHDEQGGASISFITQMRPERVETSQRRRPRFDHGLAGIDRGQRGVPERAPVRDFRVASGVEFCAFQIGVTDGGGMGGNDLMDWIVRTSAGGRAGRDGKASHDRG